MDYTASTAIIGLVPFSDGRFFGRTLPTKPNIENPFLNYVKEKSASGAINTMEFGCSIGCVSLKVPFCFQGPGMHIGIDLSEEAIRAAKASMGLLSDHGLKKSCAFLPMNCFKILDKAPQYTGKITSIFSQNLIHFFNPAQVHQFFSNIAELLVPGGRAYICVDAPDIRYTADTYNATAEVSDNTFPGFVIEDYRTVDWGTLGFSRVTDSTESLCSKRGCRMYVNSFI